MVHGTAVILNCILNNAFTMSFLEVLQTYPFNNLQQTIKIYLYYDKNTATYASKYVQVNVIF